MLPAYIIHEVLEEEKRRRTENQLEIEPPPYPEGRPSEINHREDTPPRGVAIIDYFD